METAKVLTKKRVKKIAVPKREGKRKITLIEEADQWASRYIRISNADSNGLVQCYTCGTHWHPKNIQCGHFIGRAHYSTRYDLRNMHPQCQRCNKFRSGEPGAYAYNLINELGMSEFMDLLTAGLQNHIFGEEKLQELIVMFKELTQTALREKNIQAWW